MTQIEIAKKGKISPQMKIVAEKEKIPLLILRERIKRGQIVILANKNHQNVLPIGIGLGLETKINANIGTSSLKSDLKNELEKLKTAIDSGTDTIMDLSLGGDIDLIRKTLIKNCSLPFGTVPVYQAAIEAGGIKKLNLANYLSVFEKQAKDGVDFMTVHAGITKRVFPLLKKRIMACVSRGGCIVLNWMRYHKKENFLFEGFDEILKLAKKYDVVLSLGDGLRPGCISDATDKAQIEELKTLGKLAKRAKKFGVQVIIEGPGHLPLNEIELNIKLEKKYCQGAPFFVLGPLPLDVAVGYDHIAGAIGGAIASWKGADFLCYLTPKEHIGLPEKEDVKEGVIVMRIAKEIGEIAKKNKDSLLRNKKMAIAREKLDWEEMLKYALFKEKFQELREKEIQSIPQLKKNRFCTMCGEFCVFLKKF